MGKENVAYIHIWVVYSSIKIKYVILKKWLEIKVVLRYIQQDTYSMFSFIHGDNE